MGKEQDWWGSGEGAREVCTRELEDGVGERTGSEVPQRQLRKTQLKVSVFEV